VKNIFLPSHPGAARYYREIGIKIPDELASTRFTPKSGHSSASVYVAAVQTDP
jgi:hypothetical protein